MLFFTKLSQVHFDGEDRRCELLLWATDSFDFFFFFFQINMQWLLSAIICVQLVISNQ